jgi:hypothetical protein
MSNSASKSRTSSRPLLASYSRLVATRCLTVSYRKALIACLSTYVLFSRFAVLNTHITRVLKEIEAAVDKRLHFDPEPLRKRDRLIASFQKKAQDVKRRYKDADELEAMRQQLKNVVDGFTVSWSIILAFRC